RRAVREIEGELNCQERTSQNKETSRVLRRLLIVEIQKRARNSQAPRRHRGGRASRPRRLRRSLRFASRALTRARLDGLFAIKTFLLTETAERPVSAAKRLDRQ